MHRLTGSDAGFLFFEDGSHPSTIAYLIELPPPFPTGSGNAHIELHELRQHVSERLPFLPALRWRLGWVPFGVDLPYWVDSEELDLEYHVNRVNLRNPGDESELDLLIGDIPEETFDRGRPLWKLTLIDGRSDGSQALFFQASHALFDGLSSIEEVYELLSDITTVDSPVPAEPNPPPDARLFFGGLLRQVRLWTLMPALVKLTVSNVFAARSRRRQLPIEVPRLGKDTPACSLSNSYSADRVFARASVPIDEFKRIKNAAGVSFNDLLMALTATALRNYLLNHGDLPDRPLTTMVPISLDPPGGKPRMWGNAVSNYLTTLATDVDDPWERLQQISTVSDEARYIVEILGPEIMSRWSEYLIPVFAKPISKATNTMSRRRTENPLINVIVSNFPAPDRPLLFRGIEPKAIRAFGPLANSVGVNITSVTYRGEIFFSIRSDPHALDHPEEIALGIQEALSELGRIVDAMEPSHIGETTPILRTGT
jgi:WS/DGAT/MGAT family acyltransferase